MKTVLKKTWKVLLLVAFLAGASFPLVSPPVEAIPRCGECDGGSYDAGSGSCGGTHRNCTECTVCAE